jgi:hypothetical protein
LGEAAALQVGVCDHRHERVAVQAMPGSALEVIEAEFFLELLVGLLADPSRLDRGGERLEADRRKPATPSAPQIPEPTIGRNPFQTPNLPK